MEFLADLWLPIVLSAVLVFVASSVMHMVLPFHRKDYAKLPGEDAVLAAMREAGVGPGPYMYPCPESMKDFATPEMQEKYRLGPVGVMIVQPNGVPSMGKSLGQWFAFCLVIALLVGYLSWFALAPGAEYTAVFRIAGTAGLLGYGFTSVMESIWKGQRWSVTGRFLIDGVIYALVTAGTFAGFWPGA